MKKETEDKRIIKFRAWDARFGKMRFPSSDLEENTYFTIWNDDRWEMVSGAGKTEKVVMRADHGVLMQFTGLHDANGKEIFEGDILKFKFMKDILVVEWGERGWRNVFFNNESEVIGNIYEDKHLLENND